MDAPSSPHSGERLRQERMRHNYRQQDVADSVGTTVSTVKRWERGSQQPGPYYRARLCALFGKSAEDLGLVPESSPTASPPQIEESTSVETLPLQPAASRLTPLPVRSPRPGIWNVPFARNPFFTGREDVFSHLQACFHADQPAGELPVALCGLGGMGKTQTAVEYCYRFSSAYQAVLWARADTREGLLSNLAVLAGLLELPEDQQQNQHQAITAVCTWLATHQGWLLVLDNVEDLGLIHELLPPRLPGHILLTARTQITGPFARRVELDPLTAEEGTLLLLRRCGQVHLDARLEELSASQWQLARQLSTLFDGLPLALDQAGAYIEETGCSLSHYLHAYQSMQKGLLSRRGTTGADHPASVFTTFSLTLERLAQEHPLAVDLLRLCAFLHPDAIPEELLAGWISDDPRALTAPTTYSLQLLDTILAILRRYSLLKRDPEARTFTIHRLVQAVLKEQMEEQETHSWANAVVEVVNRAFPDVEALTTWERCQRLLAQALACATLIEEEQVFSEAAGRLLQQLGIYLLEEAQFVQAESHLIHAYELRMRLFGEQHSVTAESLNYLAEIAYYQANYQRAEQLHSQALRIREQELGPQHPDVAASLNNLASAYWIQGKYRQAEPLYRRALQIREEVLGSEHLDTGEALQNLGTLFLDQGRSDEAEPLLERCLKICQQVLGSDHFYLMTIWNNLGRLYRIQGRYMEAKQLHLQAKLLGEQAHATQHTYYAMNLNSLGKLACIQQEWEQAESWYRQALQIRESVLGAEHPRTVQTLHDLAVLYHKQGQMERASKLYQQVLALREKVLPPDHPDTAKTLHQLAVLCEAQGNVQEAAALYQRALTIREHVFGTQHSKTIDTRQRLCAMLQALGKAEEAAP